MSEAIQVIIPVYNEGENILQTLEEIRSKISVPKQILVVYDFEEDNTLPVLRGYMKENGSASLSLIKNKYGKGVLNAIRTGFEASREEVVLVVMADNSDDLVVADAMFAKIKEGFDIVCASRYMKGGKQIGGPKIKGFLSRMAGLSLYYLFGFPVHDVSNSFKMYRKKVIDGIQLESKGGFEIGMEILVKAFSSGYKITEIPSVWKERTAGKSRFKILKWLPGYLHWYRLAATSSILRRLGIRGRA